MREGLHRSHVAPTPRWPRHGAVASPANNFDAIDDLAMRACAMKGIIRDKNQRHF